MKAYVKKNKVLSYLNDYALAVAPDERDTAEEHYRREAINEAAEEIFEAVAEMPAEDVNQLEHGTWWDEYDNVTVAKCSNCGAMIDILQSKGYGGDRLWALFNHEYRYCPNCGAKMGDDTE